MGQCCSEWFYSMQYVFFGLVKAKKKCITMASNDLSLINLLLTMNKFWMLPDDFFLRAFNTSWLILFDDCVSWWILRLWQSVVIVAIINFAVQSLPIIFVSMNVLLCKFFSNWRKNIWIMIFEHQGR